MLRMLPNVCCVADRVCACVVCNKLAKWEATKVITFRGCPFQLCQHACLARVLGLADDFPDVVGAPGLAVQIKQSVDGNGLVFVGGVRHHSNCSPCVCLFFLESKLFSNGILQLKKADVCTFPDDAAQWPTPRLEGA
jgi:hypothetical protein